MCGCCASFVLNLVYLRFVLNFYFGCARSSNLVAFSFFYLLFPFFIPFYFFFIFAFFSFHPFFLRCPFLLAFTIFFSPGGGGGLFYAFFWVLFFFLVLFSLLGHRRLMLILMGSDYYPLFHCPCDYHYTTEDENSITIQ